MSRITIRFDGQTANAGYVPVPVDIFDEGSARVGDMVMHLSDSRSVDVSGPGLYSVRAELPTGERVATTVRVADEMAEATATLVSTEVSPRETLAWAYAQQSVRSASGFAAGAQTSDVLDTEGYRAAEQVTSVTVTGHFLIPGAAGPAGVPWPLLNVLIQSSDDPSVHMQDLRLLNEHRFNWPGSWFFASPHTRPLPPQYDWYPVYVRWSTSATPGMPGETGLVAVPSGPYRETRLLFVRADARMGSPIRTLVNINNPTAETLLAFLEQGAYGAARAIGPAVIHDAIEILREKRDDPFAACIAGYFLLRVQKFEQQQWMQNLSDWFPKIPDGAIIYGTSLLRGEARGEDRQRARDYLLEAARRGIPVYTAGLRLLFDGLRALAPETGNDHGVTAALTAVRRIAAFADWESQTTSFSLSRSSEGPPFDMIE